MSSLAFSSILLSTALFVFFTLVSLIIKINYSPGRFRLTKTQFLIFNVVSIPLALALFALIIVLVYLICCQVIIIFSALKVSLQQ